MCSSTQEICNNLENVLEKLFEAGVFMTWLSIVSFIKNESIKNLIEMCIF